MLWGIAVSADWRLTAVAFASAMGAFVVMAVLTWNGGRIWKRIRMIETQLGKMQNEITAVLQVQAALITKLNANSKVQIVPRGEVVEIGEGEVAGQTAASLPAAPAQPESVKSGKK